MISSPTVSKRAIRSHYDLATLFCRLLWGPHIHHGLWESEEPARLAVDRLTDTLAREAKIGRGESVLDVGCGMGGSSIRLARELGCCVTGVTISPLQRAWASASARWHGVAGNTRFVCADAELVAFESATFEVVWSVECTEHLFDKAAFFRRAAVWLRPGGRLAICAWLAGDDPLDATATRCVADVCEGFLCPSLGTWADYSGWISGSGLILERQLDWTSRVMRTWEICEERVRRSRVRWLAGWLDRDSARFLDRFRTILTAYRTGAMRYGCFVARAA